jgi:hypothetical protein
MWVKAVKLVARIRTVKPLFFQSESIADLSSDFVRLLFIGLWTYVDDAGRGHDNPRVIKGSLFSLRDDVGPGAVDFGMWELHQTGHIQRYTNNGARYFSIPKFRIHQRINRPSTISTPELSDPDSTLADLPDHFINGQVEEQFSEDSVTDQGALTHGTRTRTRTRTRTNNNYLQRLSEDSVSLDETPSLPPAERLSARKSDPIWDALVDVCRINVSAIPASQRAHIAKVVRELAEVGATTVEIYERATAYRLAYPDAALTPAALVKHWASVEGVATQPKVDRNALELARWAGDD